MTMFNFLKDLYIRFLILCANDYTICIILKKYFGIKIGENTRITGKNILFGSEPFLIEIGNDCIITGGVIFETHDGGIGLLRKQHPGINHFGKIIIGNSVFIGNRAIIMPGVTIGDNVVIGAGSIVTKNIPSNSVAAGVPAKVIKSFEEYKEKCFKNAVYIKNSDPVKRKAEIIGILKDNE
jgi:acetyltransferase-like isoleucine patch superfamily enzyme